MKDKAMLRVVIASGARRVELEGPTEIVLEQLEKVRAWVSGRPVGLAPGEIPEREDDAAAAPGERVTLRTFLASKRPQNAYETIAALLAYKKSHEGKAEVSPEEIRATMMQAGIRPPAAMAQAMTDCRRRYGYVEVGSSRGTWKLSHQGETLVEIDLPRA